MTTRFGTYWDGQWARDTPLHAGDWVYFERCENLGCYPPFVGDSSACYRGLASAIGYPFELVSYNPLEASSCDGFITLWISTNQCHCTCCQHPIMSQQSTPHAHLGNTSVLPSLAWLFCLLPSPVSSYCKQQLSRHPAYSYCCLLHLAPNLELHWRHTVGQWWLLRHPSETKIVSAMWMRMHQLNRK